MKKDLYIFRHGETDFNLQHKWQGCGVDSLLNETGKKQADMLAEKVCNLGMTRLYCSPLLRAVQTANRIAQRSKKDLPVVILQDLCEGDFGAADGLTFDEVREKFGRKLADAICFPTFANWDERFPKGESKREIFNRVSSCLYRVVCDWDATIGVVCHAGVISALKCGLNLEMTPTENCSVLHLQYDVASGKFEQIKD